MVVRYAYDFNDQELEQIARAIDGDKKRRKGSKPRKATRAECTGLITGALKDALRRAAAVDTLPAALPTPTPAEPGADAAAEITRRRAREANKRALEAATDQQRADNQELSDPVCLRVNCGKPKSEHSRMGQCPGKRFAQMADYGISRD